MTTTHTTIDTPLGELVLVAEDETLSGVYFPGHWTRPDPATFGARTEQRLAQVERQLAEYFAGERTSFDLPTSATGTAFQRQVWDLIARVPYGQTTTYGQLACELGSPTLARKVGNAVAHNPLSVVIPCHRVVARDGSLTGYAGGLARKRLLLDLESGRRGHRGVEERRDHRQQPVGAVQQAVPRRDEVGRARQHGELRLRQPGEVAHHAASAQPEELDGVLEADAV
jgi:methylated-DNA-[protein]-cysteine S-methyltransferase